MSFLTKTVRRKLMLTTAMLLLPAVVLMAVLYLRNTHQADSLKQEKAGVQFLTYLRSLAQHLSGHRSLAALYHTGVQADATVRTKLSSSSSEVSKDIRTLEDLDRSSRQILSRYGQWTSIKSGWEALANAGEKLQAEGSIARHTQVMADLVAEMCNLPPDQIETRNHRPLIASCGIPLVCAPWEDCEGLFTPGEDYLIARDGEAMRHHLAALRADPDFAGALAEQGRATVIARHSCAHRVDELLAICRWLGRELTPPEMAAAQ